MCVYIYIYVCIHTHVIFVNTCECMCIYIYIYITRPRARRWPPPRRSRCPPRAEAIIDHPKYYFTLIQYYFNTNNTI